MSKRAGLLLLIFPLWLISAAIFAAASPQPAQANAVQITIPILTLIVFPTPTRTPTPINVGNFVWDDLDKDGVQDAGELGLAGVTVQLWNSSKTMLLDSDVTGASGQYSLTAPTPGSYRVRVVLPGAGDYFTVLDATGNDLTDSDINPTGVDYGFTNVYVFASNLISITTIDAGIVKFREPTPTRTPSPVHLGNFVWHDLNGDGIQQAGEPGIGGITLQLWNASKTDLITSTQSNANGSYTLVAPFPSDYRVRVLLPAGASFSPLNQGANDQTDSDIHPTGINQGFTDIYSMPSNLISNTTFDAGLVNFVATPTPTGPTPTPTVTGTPPLEGTPPPPGSNRLFLPALQN